MFIQQIRGCKRLQMVPFFNNIFNFVKYKSLYNLRYTPNNLCSSLVKNSSTSYEYFDFSPKCSADLHELIIDNFLLFNDFIHIDDEQNLLDEILPYMKRLRYEYDHWDHAIHGFKETERLKWNNLNSKILDKLRSTAFKENAVMPHVHILDLADNGYIKPHIDSVRFCGNTIAGISLLSDSVMRLVKDDNFIDVLLKRRSLYIMKGPVRYDFSHEILADEKSIFKSIKINKTRRISVICRSQPPESDD